MRKEDVDEILDELAASHRERLAREGGLERIGEPEDGMYRRKCDSYKHNPPMQIVLEPGRYRWTCPDCGERTEFVVPRTLYGRFAGVDATSMYVSTGMAELA
ncbi:MAG: hypothetical protein JRN42_07740 [Nitrososphaerota archaeon]|nr:hypothetical protein [Nitrososphaerota archaeon]